MSTSEPRPLFRRGHVAGDFLEAWAWDVLERGSGILRVAAHLPDHVRNPRGQLFGGFTPTYVDLTALATARPVGPPDVSTGRSWMSTTSMRVDYFEPIVGPKFIIDSRLEKQRGRSCHVVTRFFQDDELAVFAATSLLRTQAAAKHSGERSEN